eukprot:TRINITY_DN5481_c0_g4_i1.p1 TRINITY_DN5481_c0_g4~~TRINITY_DN5481_c0_g4_i1.p1  ORF type:complete len:308 (-),score=54.62 TRINITY_DN5481_c0_g4_i1:55-978(-)
MSKAVCQTYAVLLHVAPWWHQQLAESPSQNVGDEQQQQLSECSQLTCACVVTLLAATLLLMVMQLSSSVVECSETPDAKALLSKEGADESTRNRCDRHPELSAGHFVACDPNGFCLGMASPRRKGFVQYSHALGDALQHVAGSMGMHTFPVVAAAAAVLRQLVSSQPKSVSRLLDQSPFCKFRCCLQTELMGIEGYLLRMSQHLECSDDCFLMGLIYLDRILALDRNLVIPSQCIHRIIFTCIVIASKFHEDGRYSNSYYARIGGLTRRELLSAEIELLKMIQWDLLVVPAELNQYREDVLRVLRAS